MIVIYLGENIVICDIVKNKYSIIIYNYYNTMNTQKTLFIIDFVTMTNQYCIC